MPELVAAGAEDFIRTDIGSSFLESQIVLLLKRLDLGCRFGQGNLYSEPLARDQAERLLRSQSAQAIVI